MSASVGASAQRANAEASGPPSPPDRASGGPRARAGSQPQAAQIGLHLNLGCGDVVTPGWINVDNSTRAKLASRLPLLDRTLVAFSLLPATPFAKGVRAVNLLRGWPWRTETVAAIYMGELLEHFTREEADHLLREASRVLRPGGVLRIRVPDNGRFWQRYLEEYLAMRQRPRAEWRVDHTRWIAMFFDSICVRRPAWYRTMGHFHKWMYDDVSLICLLERHGFREVARMPFLESRLADVAAVEVRDDLIVEAVK